jgi:hypothetical protein
MRPLACCVWFVLSGLTFACFVRGEEPSKVLPPEIEKLVAEHEATWAKIETLDVEYETTASIPISAPSKTLAGRWIRGEGFERLVAEQDALGPGGVKVVRIEELSAIGSECRSFTREIGRDYERESFDESYVRRWLAMRSQQWMRQFAHELGGEMTLRELVTEWPTTLEEEATGSSGDRLRSLKALRPVAAGSPEAGSFVCVTLNLDKGCLVQRVDQLAKDGGLRRVKAPAKPTPVDVGNVLVATDFLDCGDGIWFPAEVRGYILVDCLPEDMTRLDDYLGIVTWKTVSAKANEPLDSSIGGPIAREASIANSFGNVPQPAILPLRR